jgi:hypothetical protein
LGAAAIGCYCMLMAYVEANGWKCIVAAADRGHTHVVVSGPCGAAGGKKAAAAAAAAEAPAKRGRGRPKKAQPEPGSDEEEEEAEEAPPAKKVSHSVVQAQLCESRGQAQEGTRTWGER